MKLTSNIKTIGELNLAYSRLGKQVFELEDLSKAINDKVLFEHLTEIIQKVSVLVLLGQMELVKQHS